MSSHLSEYDADLIAQRVVNRLTGLVVLAALLILSVGAVAVIASALAWTATAPMASGSEQSRPLLLAFLGAVLVLLGYAWARALGRMRAPA
jgi:predicted acyltransferase